MCVLFGGGRGGREMLTGKAGSHCYLRFPAECQKLQQMQLRRVGGGEKLEGEQLKSQDFGILLRFLVLLILTPGEERSSGEPAALPSPTLPTSTFRTFIISAQGWSVCL